MTITTVEALTEVPEGTQVLVRSPTRGAATWTRTRGGLIRGENDVPVAVDLFEGYLVQGMVERAEPERPPQPGDFYRTPAERAARVYFVDRVEETRVHAQVFRTNGFLRENWYSVEAIMAMQRCEPEAQGFVSTDLIRRMRVFYTSQITELQAALTQAQEALTKKPEQAEAAPTTERVVVTVTVRGNSAIPDLIGHSAAMLPRNAHLMGNLVVGWEYTYRYPVDVPPGTCACDTLDTDKVAAGLPPNTATWTATPSCVYGEPF